MLARKPKMLVTVALEHDLNAPIRSLFPRRGAM
jgi:hypothetical protein